MKRRAFLWTAAVAVVPAPRAPECIWAFVNRMLERKGLQYFTLAAGYTVNAGQLVCLRPDGTVAPAGYR